MRAMMVAMEDHRSSKFPELTLSVFQQLKKVFKTETGQPFIFSGSGTGAWEAALTNTLSPGDKVLAPPLWPIQPPLDRSCAARRSRCHGARRGMGNRRLA
jgi:hypothetical protein